MNTFLYDLRHALRQLRRSPGFAAVAIATLALGIGGSTAVFTVVDRVLLRPLSLADADRLALIRERSSRPLARRIVSREDLQDWGAESRAFEGIAGRSEIPMNLTGEPDPVEVLVDAVTPNFFHVLGVSAYVGRTFTIGARLTDVEPEAILSHALWQQRYGGARKHVLKTIPSRTSA